MQRFSKYLIVFYILSTAVINSYGQKKFLKKLDTSWTFQNRYIAKYNAESFNKAIDQDKIVDPDNVDYELIEAILFFRINEYRKKRKYSEFKYSSKLDRMGHTYISYFKHYRFRSHYDNYYRLKRTITKVPKYYKLDFTYVEGYMQLPYVVDYTGGKVYFDEEVGASDLDLYRGSRHSNRNKEPKPIDFINYRTLCDRLFNKFLKGKSSRYLRSKAFDLIAIKAAEKGSRSYQKRVPQIKLIYLVGGYRTKLLIKNRVVE